MPAPEQEHSGVRPSTGRVSTAERTHDADARVQLRVHRESALLPVDLAQVLFARAVGVAARSVDLPGERDHTSGSAVWECAYRGADLVVAVRLEDVEDRFDVFEVVDTGTCRVCSAAFSRNSHGPGKQLQDAADLLRLLLRTSSHPRRQVRYVCD